MRNRIRDHPWTSLDGYFKELEHRGTAINLGTYVGTSSVRQAVMGDVTRHPTSAEMSQMGALIDSAMRDGALGLGTGLIYLPSTFFTTEELIALTKYVAPYRGGYATHMRSEGAGLARGRSRDYPNRRKRRTWAEIRHIKSRSPSRWRRQSHSSIPHARQESMSRPINIHTSRAEQDCRRC